jgi:hypothetical protein
MSILDLRDASRLLRPEVPAHPHLRAAAIGTWRGRMINEHSSARVFDGLAGQLEAAGLAAEIASEVRGFADEERRHGVLCGAVVEALGGEAYAEIPRAKRFPRTTMRSPRSKLPSATCSASAVSARPSRCRSSAPSGSKLGLCSGSDARRLFLDTVEQVIVPGLERHGIPARRAWLASEAQRAA